MNKFPKDEEKTEISEVEEKELATPEEKKKAEPITFNHDNDVVVMPLCMYDCYNYGVNTAVDKGGKKGGSKSTSYSSPDVVHKFFGRFNFARKKAILKTLLTALKRSLSKHIDIDLILRLKGLLLLLLHIAASNSA